MGKLTHTVKGPIASFRSADITDIESLKFHFLPKQEGSGDPSLQNVRPIVGWTGCNGRKVGKNLIKPYYTESTVKNGLNITPTINGIHISGTAEIRTACFIACLDHIPLSTNDKIVFSLYVNGDISQCENPFLGYYKRYGEFGASIGSLTNENNYKKIWTVESGYSGSKASYFDSYIYVPAGISVDFEIGLQMEKGTNATAYEPYSEELIPITFPTSGKNLVSDENVITSGKNMTKVGNRTYTNTDADTKSSVDLYVVQYNNNKILKTNVYYGSVSLGRIGRTFDIVKNCSKILLKHNGSTHDLGVFIPWDGRIGTYTISANFEGIDPSTIGGFVFSDIQIELGDTATTYEPYSSDNTFYGGYIDPIAGEIVAEYCGINSTWGAGVNNTVMGNTERRRYPLLGPTPSGAQYETQKCNVAKYGYDFGADYVHVYCAINSNGYLFLPIDTDDNTAIQITYKLATPIHIPIPVQDMKTFLDHNNFWSDTNDDTEVEYTFTDHLSKRKLTMNIPHIESTSGSVVSFNTDMKAPIVDLKAYFTPIQEGTGDPSPVNKRPIHGFTKLMLHHDGKNIIDLQSATWSGDSNKVSYSISGGNVTITAKTSGRVGFVGS